MASSKEFKNFILEQLGQLENIDCKPMMGEFLLYYNETLFGGIYDDRFLIKKTKTNQNYALPEAIPYPKGKPMFLVENVDEPSYLSEIVKATYLGLKK